MALSKPIGDVIAEELECGICLDRLKSPRLLTCLHSFCEHCLQQCADQSLDGYLRCPTCQEQTVIPNTGITGLKPDFRANKLLEALDQDGRGKHKATVQQNCSLCTSSKACLICKECDFKMCPDCAECHPKVCRYHHTIPLMSVDVETSVAIRKCPRHDERLKFYCKSCKICICADCTVLDHSKLDGHECVYLKEIVPQFRRDVAELVTQIDVKAKNLDSLSAKIVATNQKLDEKSSDIEQAIEHEVAKIKTTLLDHSHNYIKKKREAIRNIEKRIRADKKAVQDVATAVHQVASSRDDLEVAEMHHSLHESFKKITSNNSDTTALDNLQTKFETLTLKCTDKDSSLHTSINLVQQDRVLERQNVPHAKRYYAVSRKDKDTLCVIYATQNEQLSYHNVQRNKSSLPDLENRQVAGAFGLGAGFAESTATFSPLFGSGGGSQWQKSTTPGTHCCSGKTCRCPFDIHPNGQICYVTRDELYKGSTPLTLHPLHQKKDNRGDDNIEQGPSMAVNREGCIYVATACLDFILEILPNNTLLSSKPIGNIVPLGITICSTSPYETILIAHKPASVSLINSQQDIKCIFNDDESVVWQNAAITCGHDGRVYLLSSRDSKVTLQILDKEGNLLETIFRGRPVTSKNQSLPEQAPQHSGRSSSLSSALFASPSVPQGEALSMFGSYSAGRRLPEQIPQPIGGSSLGSLGGSLSHGGYQFGSSHVPQAKTSIFGSSFSAQAPQPSTFSFGASVGGSPFGASVGGFLFGGVPYVPPAETPSIFASSSASHSSPVSRLGLPPRLSIAVASNGDIAAVLGEDELVLITLQEIDVRKT